MIRFTESGPVARSARERAILNTLSRVYGIDELVRQYGYPGYVYHVAPILKGAGIRVDEEPTEEIRRQLLPLKGWDGKEYRWLDTINELTDEVTENFAKLSGVPLHTYAKADAAEIATHDQAILAYEPGLGKTSTSLAIAWLWGASKVLVVAPRRLHVQWISEADRIGLGLNIRMVSYEDVVRTESDWRDFDVVIVDEAHNIKNPETERFKAMMMLATKRRLALTGTPIGGYVQDIYGIVRWVTDKAGYLNPLPPDFREIYGVRSMSRELPGLRFGERLRDKLAPIIKIRLRAEPEVNIAGQNARLIRERIRMEPELRRFYLQNARMVREWWLSEDAQTEARARLGLHRLIRAAAMPQTLSGWGDKQTDLQNAVIDIAKRNTASNPIVMASHIDVAKFYAEQLGVKALTSRMTIKTRQRVIDEWKNNGGILVGTVGVLGEGWNLQESSLIIFAEMDWRAWMIVQAIYRILRPGQAAQPRIVFAYYADSVMEYMAKVVANKAEAILAFNVGESFAARMPSHREMLTKLVLIEKEAI